YDPLRRLRHGRFIQRLIGLPVDSAARSDDVSADRSDVYALLEAADAIAHSDASGRFVVDVQSTAWRGDAVRLRPAECEIEQLVGLMAVLLAVVVDDDLVGLSGAPDVCVWRLCPPLAYLCFVGRRREAPIDGEQWHLSVWHQWEDAGARPRYAQRRS